MSIYQKYASLAVFLLSIFVLGQNILLAHGGEEHKKNSKPQISTEAGAQNTKSREESSGQGHNALSLEQFASLHPLVVHFPIVFLLVAPGLWLWAIFSKERNLYRVAFVSGIFGLIGALVAGTFVHPHTTELLPVAQATLDKHDFWAELTIQSALASLLLMSGALWVVKFGKHLKIAALLVALFAALAVSLTGHYGASLTHVHGVGPQGKYLEIHEGDGE